MEMIMGKEYGYVAIVVVVYCCLNMWMGFQVVKARKKYKRGHQNSLEMMPVFFILIVLGGMGHPCVSAALGLFYTVTRYFYFTGYSTGDPQNRLTIGKYGFLALFGLMICTISFGIKLLRS
ncbi:hypothetical protein V6Z11_1Z134000 [Gossypium hirsutum]